MMPKLPLALALLILLCYLCPFQSCGWKGATITQAAAADDTTAVATVATEAAPPTTARESLTDRAVHRLLFPTDDSISGLGIMLSAETNRSAYALIASFVLSLLMLLVLLVRGRRQAAAVYRLRFMAVLNLLALGAYALGSLVANHGPLLWGYWLLVVLVIAQLGLALKSRAGLEAHHPSLASHPK